MYILLAEDDPNIKTIALLTLEHFSGHQVVAVENGKDALHEALTKRFDLILLDEMMPELNGLSVAGKLREQSYFKTPIIFLSAKSQAHDIQQFLKFGNGYITKPFDPMTLNEKILSIVKGLNSL